MAVAQSNIVKVQELVDYINTNLKATIQGQIVWHQGNLPANFPSSWVSRFQSGAAIPAMTTGHIKAEAVGNVAKISDLYAALQSLLMAWSCVRRVRFIYQTGHNNYTGKGGAHTWDTQSDTTQFAFLDPTYGTDLFALPNSNKQAAGDKVLAAKMTSLITSLYNTWNSMGALEWTHQTCHTNCHNSCHGSGGFR